MQQFRPLPL